MLIKFQRQPIPLTRQLRFAFNVAVVLALVEAVNLFSGRLLNNFGIVPRDIGHLYGIFTAPWIHGNLLHFTSNLMPLLIFTVLVFQHGRLRFWLVTWGVVILGGLAVWFFGRPAVHIGASGLIFGYFGFLILAGFLSKEPKLLVISLLVAVFYGGLIWGVLPQAGYISFESHLFGFIAGLAMAFIVGRAR